MAVDKTTSTEEFALQPTHLVRTTGTQADQLENLPDADLVYRPHYLNEHDAEKLKSELTAYPGWEQLRLRIFGRNQRSPRLTAWFGDASYAYSGIVHPPRPWPTALALLRERLATDLGCDFNGVLANLYRDGADGMGWHSDDEPELGQSPTIASVSLGGPRRFRLRHRTRRDLRTVDLALENGSLLVMKGATQQHWKHCIPKTRRPVALRVNLTFRSPYDGR